MAHTWWHVWGDINQRGAQGLMKSIVSHDPARDLKLVFGDSPGKIWENIRKGNIGDDYLDAELQKLGNAWESIPEENRKAITDAYQVTAQAMGQSWQGAKQVDNWWNPMDVTAAGAAHTLEKGAQAVDKVLDIGFGGAAAILHHGFRMGPKTSQFAPRMYLALGGRLPKVTPQMLGITTKLEKIKTLNQAPSTARKLIKVTDDMPLPVTSKKLTTTPIKAQIPRETSFFTRQYKPRDVNVVKRHVEQEQRIADTLAGKAGTGVFAMTKNPKKLSKKQVAANAAAETKIALTLDATGNIQRSVPPELDFLSKLSKEEQASIITRAITLQNESEQYVPGDKKISAQSLGTGEKIFNQPPEVKLAAGLQREAPWMLKKFGFLWDSAVEQAHHWFQKAFTGPFIQHMVKLARDPNSPITFYDVANMEAAAKSRGLPGVGDSGVGGIVESIHQHGHKTDRKLGREPTGGMPLSDAEMTPKQLKAEKARQKKFDKHYKETGEDIEELFPGPSLGVLLKNGFKLKTAKELTQYYMDIADEFYVPQMKRMQKLNEAARDDLTGFAHNVEKYRFMRDDIKAIIRGDAPNTLGYTKEQLKAKKDEYSFKYKDARDAQVKSAIKIDEGRDITKEHKAEITLDNLLRGYEPGTPEYKYIEWMYEDELQRTRWRTGGGTQSFGRVR